MKKINFNAINSVMGREQSPIQRQFSDKKFIVRKVVQPFKTGSIPNNNDPCPCGSGMKFKKCCK